MIGIGRGHTSRLKLPPAGLPVVEPPVGRKAGARRRVLTLFVFTPGRETPRRLPLPGWLLLGGLLVIGLLAAGGYQLWQQNQALEAQVAALHQTQGLGDTREGELDTVLGLQKDKLAAQATQLQTQASQLQTQDQQLIAIQHDLDDLKDRMANLDRHNAQLREVLGLDTQNDALAILSNGALTDTTAPATPTPSGPDSLAPAIPAPDLSAQGGDGPPLADPAAAVSSDSISALLTHYQFDLGILTSAIAAREQAMGALDNGTGQQVAAWAKDADEQPAGPDTPDVAAALAQANAQAAAPPSNKSDSPPARPPSSIPSGLPFYGAISSPFGWRDSPFIAGARTYHKGMDIVAPIGTPVRATQDGTVIISGWTDWYGQTIMIDHGHGWVTIYGHNSKLKVKVGDYVAQGQIVSLSGNTGPSTGPHIHYEIRHNGTPVNPANYR